MLMGDGWFPEWLAASGLDCVRTMREIRSEGIARRAIREELHSRLMARRLDGWRAEGDRQNA